MTLTFYQPASTAFVFSWEYM